MAVGDKRVQVSVTIPGRLVDEADQTATEIGLTRSALISLALYEYLRAHREREEEVVGTDSSEQDQ